MPGDKEHCAPTYTLKTKTTAVLVTALFSGQWIAFRSCDEYCR